MNEQRTEKQNLVPAWAPQPLIERLKTCRVMLYQHGMISESERARIDARIDKRELEAARGK